MQRWLITTWTMALTMALLAGTAEAGNLEPSSVLVYPVFYGDKATGFFGAPVKTDFNLISVTNTSRSPIIGNDLGGTTRVHFEFVDAVPTGGLGCIVQDRSEFLTPADTLTVVASCFTFGLTRGYMVISAEDPNHRPWSHNFLVGSEVVIRTNGFFAFFSLPAIGFESPLEQGEPTDVDGDGQLDFDGIEYEGVPDELIVDSFIASSLQGLVLINLTGGATYSAVAEIRLWNDNEYPLSATLVFKCWTEQRLVDISLIFQPSFLANNTAHDPHELDLNCDGKGDVETGWVAVNGGVAFNDSHTVKDPALLGAIAGRGAIDGGRPLWHSKARQHNGKFLNFAPVDKEL